MTAVERDVEPNDCALLIALPTNEDEFIACASPRHRRDYVPRMVDTCGSSAAAWRAYAHYARHMNGVMKRTEHLGCFVRARSTLDDLRGAILSHSVVIPVAHSFISSARLGFSEEALVQLLSTVHGEQTSFAVSLREAILSLEAESATPTDVAAAIAAAIDAEHIDLIELDVRCPAVLRHIAIIELFDGLIEFGTMLGALAPQFTGVLDLSFCRSAPLVRSIKARCPHATVVSSEDEMYPLGRLTRLAAAMRVLGNRRMQYTAALADVTALVHREEGP